MRLINSKPYSATTVFDKGESSDSFFMPKGDRYDPLFNILTYSSISGLEE